MRIERAPGQVRALLSVGGEVVEAWHDFDHDRELTGSVHVVRLERGVGADNRMYAGLADGTQVSVRTVRGRKVRPGDLATVTITSCPRENKPWQAVMGARLAGPRLTLLPGGEGVHIAALRGRTPDERLRRVLEDHLAGTSGYGVLVERDLAIGDGAGSGSGGVGVQGSGGTARNEGVARRGGASGSEGFQGGQGASGRDGVQGGQGASGSEGVAKKEGASGSKGVAGNEGTQGSGGKSANEGAAGSGVSLVSAGDIAGECDSLIAAWEEGAKEVDAAGCVFDGGSIDVRMKAHIGRVLPGIAIEDVSEDAAHGKASDFDTAWDAMVDEVVRLDAPMPGGGVIWVETTRALTAIDLDSGTGGIDAMYAQAPAAIARQLRLRQTAGHVTIDVPRMDRAVRERFGEALRGGLGNDSRVIEWIGWTRAGHLELLIKRGRRGPASWAADPTVCGALGVLRQIWVRPTLADPEVRLPPDMAEWLHGPGAGALRHLDRQVRLVKDLDIESATLCETAR